MPAQAPPASPVESFFTELFKRDASGRLWLEPLLQAAPRGAARFGALLASPESLSMSLSVRGMSGRFGCFEYPLAPSRQLTSWLIDHPERLVWPDGVEMSSQMLRLRRALLFDDPAGSRSRAQRRAHELVRSRSILSREWWRFEDLATLDCVLITDRLVVTVDGGEFDARVPATPWFPSRSRLVRTIEAARDLAGERRWGCLLMTQDRVESDDETLTDDALADAAPHLDPAERSELRAGYLGNLTWSAAAGALGLSPPPRN